MIAKAVACACPDHDSETCDGVDCSCRDVHRSNHVVEGVTYHNGARNSRYAFWIPELCRATNAVLRPAS